MSAKTTERALVLRAIGMLVAWLVVLAHLASTLHFALISHQVCADHGELLHASAAQSHAPSKHSAGRAALPGGDHREHDHCPLLARRHEQLAVLAGPALESVRALIEPAPQSEPDTQVRPARAQLLLTAPKQSPPV